MSAKRTEDIDTEQLIIETAMQVFFTEGRFKATTQEIADAAGVNRTLINYYFRSRDNLLDSVFQHANKCEHETMEKITFSQLPFKEKIRKHIEMSYQQAEKYPYLEMYMVTHMNQGNCYKNNEAMGRMLDKIYLEIGIEMDKGNIEKMRPEQFILNMVSLMSFPISMRSLFQESMGFTKESYDKLLAERTDIIMKMLFKN